MNNLKITYSQARYDGPLNINRTMQVAKVEYQHTSDKAEAKRLMDLLSDEDRLDVMANYCKWCDTKDLPCFCMRDD